MFASAVIVFTLCFCSLNPAFGQDCPSRQQLQGTLKQVQKLLSTYEASNLQSLRNLKKKINQLQSATGKQTTKATNSTCPKLEAPLNGRKLGKSHSVGHEVHFLCDPGYELVGSESRVCQDGLTWSGQQPSCQDINECACSPCLNGGTCVDETNKFSCICAKGWVGGTCETPVQPNTNACACSPCLNGGTCLAEGDKFSCICTKSWTGETCHSRVSPNTNACECSPCLNGGTCLDDGKDFSCLCAKGWDGDICQNTLPSNTSACECSPCLNGGTCVAEGNKFSCVCTKGWTGPTCQSWVSPNSSACECFPCLHGGTCVDEGNEFSCVCTGGWTGATCEKHPTADNKECECSPCLNGGTCVDDGKNFFCLCPKGWDGETCETPKPTNTSACECSPCLNGGTCVNEGNRFSCVCTTGWGGATCQNSLTDTRACECSPCLNGGTCVDEGMKFSCVCDRGWEGETCENRVSIDNNACACSPCLNGGTCVDEGKKFSCLCAKGWAGATCQNPLPKFFVIMTNTSAASNAAAAATLPATTTGPYVRPSRCTITQGTTHCTCEPGYTISGRDSNTCTDIDECELFHNGQGGRLCLHACVNTPGGYRCSCPAGYNSTKDGRSCKDIDECATRQNNCTKEQMCVNTYGGFQCVRVECPKIAHATYVKTSPMRCERNPCPVDNKACSQTPNSFSYHYLAVVSNLSAPRVMFRVSALRPTGDTLRFSLLGGKLTRRHFTVQRSDRQTGQLMLVSPVQGPATLEAEVEMSELERGVQLGRFITRVTMFVSQYDF